MKIGKTTSEKTYKEKEPNLVDISSHIYREIYKQDKKRLPPPVNLEENEDIVNKNNINNDSESNKKFSTSEEEKHNNSKEEDISKEILLEEIKIAQNIKEPGIKKDETKVEESINYENFFRNYNNINIQKIYQAEENLYEMSKIKFNVKANNNIINEKIENNKDIKSVNLQKKYKEGNEIIRESIFNALIGNYCQKSMDEYYNYLIQIIIEIEGKRCYYKIKIIAYELQGNYFKLSEDNNGTYVVQKLIQFLDDAELKMITDELISNEKFAHLMFDSNGNHVIQKLILNINKNGLDFRNLFGKINENIVPFCKNRYSSYIIQVLLDKCDLKLIKTIIGEIKDENLLNDIYGLHVVQKLLEIYHKENNRFDLNFIYEHFTHINIYEKILKSGDNISSSFSKIIQLLLKKGNKDKNGNIIKELIKDQNLFLQICSNKFGNHVAQKAYDNSSNEIKDKIKNIIEENKKKIKNKFFNFVVNHILK